jgi:hypothetical protein
MGLISGLTLPPAETLARRRAEVAQILDRLASFEIDGERLIREILVYQVARAIVIGASLPLILADDFAELEALAISPVLKLWSILLLGSERSPSEWAELALENGREWAMEQFRKALNNVERVANWLRDLPLEGFVEWQPPTTLEFGAIELTPRAAPLAEDGWITDRFTATYLHEWDRRSLELEWNFLHGRAPAPCSQAAMRTRSIAEPDLAEAIANSVTEDRPTRGQFSHSVTVGALIERAAELTSAGRRSVAASLFDAVRVADPRNAEAHNNWAFCVLPDDPALALEALAGC